MRFSSSPNRPEAWKEMKLADICKTFTSGGTPSRKKQEYFENGTIPWVRTKELNDGVITEVEEFITPDALKNSSAKMLPKNTVLLAMYGATVGKLGVLGIESSCNQACAAMVPIDGVVDYRYLYYLLLNHRELIISQATGGAQQNLSGELIKGFTFDFPTYKEQLAISEVLWKIDEKIAANNSLSKILENIAQTIFKSWFIDFDPVRAKIAGEEPAGMDAATAALFPDSMDESELGLIPKGWKVTKLFDFAGVQKKTINPQNFPDYRFHHYSLPGFDSGKTPANQFGHEIQSNKFILNDPCVLVSKLNPSNPRKWLVLAPDANSISSTEFIPLTPKRIEALYFLNCNIRTARFQSQMVSRVTGSTGSHQRVKPDDMLNIEQILPSMILVEEFARIVSPMFHQIESLNSNSNSLKLIRDSLLPRLVSGDLQIPQEMLTS